MRKYKFSDVENYFSNKVDNLKKLLNSGYRYECSILALCYIDALGNLFREEGGSRKRFINLIFSCNKPESSVWDKVNLAELKKIMQERQHDIEVKEKYCDDCYGKVVHYIEQKISEYDYSNSRKCIEKDRRLCEEKKDLEIFEKKFCGCGKWLFTDLENSTYAGILYKRYRCEGVHEARLEQLWDSLSMHFEGPFYMSIVNSLPDFSFPPEFIINTLEHCLISLKNS